MADNIFKPFKDSYNKLNNEPYIFILDKVKKYGFELPADINPETADEKDLNKLIQTRQFAEAFMKFIVNDYKHMHEFQDKFLRHYNNIMFSKPLIKDLPGFVLHKMESGVKNFLHQFTDKHHEEVEARINKQFNIRTPQK